MFEMSLEEKMLLADANAELKGERRKATTLCVSVALGEEHPSALAEASDILIRLTETPDGMEPKKDPLLEMLFDGYGDKATSPDLSTADKCRYALVGTACSLALGFLGTDETSDEEMAFMLLMTLYKAGFILMLEEHENNKEKNNA